MCCILGEGGLDVVEGGDSSVLILVEGAGLADGLEQLVVGAREEGLPDVLQVPHELGFAAIELLGVALHKQVVEVAVIVGSGLGAEHAWIGGKSAGWSARCPGWSAGHRYRQQATARLPAMLRIAPYRDPPCIAACRCAGARLCGGAI